MLFKKAAKLKLRFPTNRGQVSVEDLFDMPLTSSSGFSLDDLAKSLNKLLKESSEESFVVEKSPGDEALELSFEIVKEVIKDKLEEREAAQRYAENKAKKQKILEILEEKEDSALKRKSKADLEKMLEEL